jgi:hypothetical protein
MIFALIGDYQYRECMELNISQIRKFHPNAQIVIGDLGGNSDWDYMVIDLSGQAEREAYMMMKPIFFLMNMPTDTILMDGDTVLMDPLDIDWWDYEAVVTVRKSKHGRINSGVVLSGGYDFASSWLSNGIKRLAGADLSTEQLCEQNALIDTVDSGKFNVKEVPCDVYNYPKVENGIPDSVKIVHLKSGRFKNPELIQIVKNKIQ